MSVAAHRNALIREQTVTAGTLINIFQIYIPFFKCKV